MRFIDYETSNITPTMTLLQKQNEILKFLRESYNPHLYEVKLYENLTLKFISTTPILSPNDFKANYKKFISGYDAENNDGVITNIDFRNNKFYYSVNYESDTQITDDLLNSATFVDLGEI